mmetsp:Transcript_2013/g.5280  ORF Transcript_2013/g.5280 Transcript_2013/m.5280 type:complete len:223 (-) Transcript_2013:18-686(-)
MARLSGIASRVAGLSGGTHHRRPGGSCTGWHASRRPRLQGRLTQQQHRHPCDSDICMPAARQPAALRAAETCAATAHHTPPAATRHGRQMRHRCHLTSASAQVWGHTRCAALQTWGPHHQCQSSTGPGCRRRRKQVYLACLAAQRPFRPHPLRSPDSGRRARSRRWFRHQRRRLRHRCGQPSTWAQSAVPRSRGMRRHSRQLRRRRPRRRVCHTRLHRRRRQ